MNQGSGIGDSKSRKFFHRHVYIQQTRTGKIYTADTHGKNLVGDGWRRGTEGGEAVIPLPVSRFLVPASGAKDHGAGCRAKESGLVFKTGFSNRRRSTRFIKLSI